LSMKCLAEMTPLVGWLVGVEFKAPLDTV